MAKPICNPRSEPLQVTFPLPPFISQAELVNVLRLRSQMKQIQMELEVEQTEILRKLEDQATTERGPWTCAAVNLQLCIWKDSDFAGRKVRP